MLSTLPEALQFMKQNASVCKVTLEINMCVTSVKLASTKISSRMKLKKIVSRAPAHPAAKPLPQLAPVLTRVSAKQDFNQMDLVYLVAAPLACPPPLAGHVLRRHELRVGPERVGRIH